MRGFYFGKGLSLVSFLSSAGFLFSIASSFSSHCDPSLLGGFIFVIHVSTHSEDEKNNYPPVFFK